MSRQKISIITPCFNEEANIEQCVARVRSVMETELGEFDYEHIISDNASTDGSREILRAVARQDPRVKVAINSKNVGPFRNMAVGLRAATGDLVVPMIPADLQDPPEVIPELVAALGPDRDVVYGVRKNRRESFVMRAARDSYYRLVRAAGGAASPPPHAGEFLIARRSVIDSVIPALGSYPYIRGLVAQATERYGTVEYEWGQREHGKSRNSIPDLIDQALNGLVSTARAPIRVALFLGVFIAAAGMLYGLVSLLLFAFGLVHADPGIPTLIVAVTFFGGLQMLFLGLIGEYVVSIQAEVRPSPQAVQVEKLNL
ncbi:glycosyltransferase family 2 protein [Microbacterium laevaniformans]|uniref:glycosyltransferase family 2 protein n=1 Tax=Microbacterium laevaniformans TaxID=36807 RepID=UPI00195DED43|nr:glycosyltransferase family 2 protein [Microbacterium laevaniformans]MBM7751781.1 glycosyltransferase involved in cell wall biosynthesis [Microbacterium laevaniformans]GLJ63865.1 glycosyl hydrolase [Microbacterium laevaniformans]